MNHSFWRNTLLLIAALAFANLSFGGNTPCAATPIPNNMTSFQTFNNLGNTDSGVPAPDCGNYTGADFWFSVTVPFTGMLNIATLSGGMTNAAMAIYEAPCANPNLISCTEDDNCGNTIMPIMNLTGLNPGATLYIRIWAEGGGPNGTFEIRVSDGPIGAPPVPTTSTVGTAQLSNDCVQLTTTGTGQTGCAWDPNQINMNMPFDETFSFNFGNNDGGADGICWAFQNNPAGLSTCGNSGGTIASDFTNSFIIEFDTWDNGPAASDIPNDHAAINANGDQLNTIDGPADLGNIEDGQDHEIRFVWDPATNGYEVYFDGALTLSGSYDIINNSLGGNPNCYWGFTASTGGAVNNQSVCPVDVPEYPAGSQSTVDVVICEGESYFAGGGNQTTSGLYTDITPLPNGCSETLNTNLTVLSNGLFSYDVVLCEGECTTVANSQVFCTTGTHEVVLNDMAANGCDSIITLNLTVLDPIAVASPPAPITCFNPQVLIDASFSTAGPGFISYSWTGPNPSCFVSGQFTATPVVNCPGEYTMTLIQLVNGTPCSAITVVEVIDGAILPTVEAGNNQSFDCSTNCVTLSSAGSDTGPDITTTWTGPGFSSNDPNPEVCEPGVYTLTLLNAATGCLASDFVTVSGNATVPNIDAVVSGLLTCNDLPVTLDGSASTATGPLDFEWFDPSSTSISMNAMVDVTEMGIYTLVITDAANGCTADTMIVVNENINEPMAVANALDELDCTGNSIILDGSSSSGVGTITYEWQNVSGGVLGVGPTYAANTAGTYILVITDSDNGCTASTSEQVIQSINPPMVSATVSGDLTCADLQVTLDGTASSGIGTISYEWQDPTMTVISGTGMTDVNATGTYTLIITDAANGCTASTTIMVDENVAEPNPIADVDDPLTCSDMEAILDGGASTGIGTISHEWFDMAGISVGSDATLSVSNTETYTLVITDAANGCTAETTINATEDIQAPNPDITADGTLTCADMEVELDGSASSGIGTITYEWLDPSGTSIGLDPTVDVSTTNTYTLIITDDANGCTAEATFNPMENVTAPNPVATVTDVLTCTELDATLDGTTSSGIGVITYEWLDAGGISIGMDETIDVQDTDTYTLIITDAANGCTAETTINADQNITAPDADAGANAFITCTDPETTLDGGNSSTGTDYSYEWINEGGVSVGDEITVDVTETGIYTLVVTDETNGCTATATAEVEPDANLPIANAGIGGTITCTDLMVNLDGSDSSTGANISYEWFDPADVSLGVDLAIDVMAEGTYVLIVTNSDNGCTATSSVEVELDTEAPMIELDDIPVFNCGDTEVTVNAINNANGTLTFEWLDIDETSLGTGESIMLDEATDYTVVATNTANGCTATTDFEITEDTNAPIADAGMNGLLDCNNPTYVLDGSNSTNGVDTYEWLDEDDISIGMGATLEVSDIGIYTLVVTNGTNGCTSMSDVEVTENTQSPIAEAGDNMILNCDTDMVVLDAGNSTGGTLTYEWQNSDDVIIDATVSTSVTEIGTYTVLITNTDNGCTASDFVEVTGDFTTPTVDPGTADLLTCLQTSIDLDGSSSTGNGPVSFEWFDEDNTSLSITAMVNVNATGNYTLVVTNEMNGCTASESITVDENIIAPMANAGQGAALTCEDTEVTLIGSGTSQSGNTAYEWQNEGGVTVGDMPSVIVSEIGTYTLIVTDETNGCTAMSTVEVTPDANLPTANAGMSYTLTCEDTLATLDGINSSIGANYIYQWLAPNGDMIGNETTQTTNETGVYTLVVTDTNNSCTATSTVEVFENIDPPNADAGMDATLTCDQNLILLNGGMSTVNSGVITIFNWFDETGTLISDVTHADVTTDGIYTLVITGNNGCTDSDTVEVMLDENVPEAVVGAGGLLTCEDLTVVLGDANSNTGLNVTYQWTDSNGDLIDVTPTIQITDPDTYTLLVINQDNDCEATADLEILQDVIIPDADAGIDETLTCDLTSYELGGLGTSTGSDFSYEWLDESTLVFDTELNTTVATSGTYTLMVTNELNGCTNTSMVSIDQNITTPTADAGTGGILTCDVSEVILDGSNSTGTNLAYEWQNESGAVLDFTPIIGVTETGTFTLIVTNTDNGCTAESMTTVTPDANLPTAMATPDGLLTCTVDMVNLDGSSSSSISGNTSFEWQNDAGMMISDQDNIDVMTAGMYTLIITDEANGCSTSTLIEVDQDIAVPIVDPGMEQTLICGQTEATLTGTASNGTDLIYEWQDGLGMTIGNLPAVDVTSAGTYTLIVTNNENGCSAQASVALVPDNNLPTAEAGTSELLTCATTSVILNGLGSSQGTNFNYEWQNEMGMTLSEDLSFNVDNPGTYTLIVLDTDNNCAAEDQVIVDQNITDPMAFTDFGSAQSLDCNNTSITLDGSGSSPFGDLTFVWNTSDGSISSGANTINPEINAPGTYTLVVTNEVNGCTDTEQITVDQDITPPNILINDPDLINCIESEIVLDATASSNVGDLTYTWTGTGIISGGNTLEPLVNQSGMFTLSIVNNENGCEEMASITVEEDTTPPLANASTDEEFDCLTESVSLSGDGSSSGAGISYVWTGSGNIDAATSLTPTVFSAGIYTLVVTAASNGCTGSDEVIVLEDTNVPVAVDFLIDSLECFGDVGNISVLDVEGGSGPYLYSLDGGDNFTGQNFFTNLDPGNYELVIQDANGCEHDEELFIPGVIELDVSIESDVLIDLGDNYEIETFINIPEEEIDTIIWSPAEGLSCADCLNPVIVDTIPYIANYTVTVINQNGCSDTDQIMLRVKKDRNVFIPNIFTPDNDGINDVFMVFANGDQIREVKNFQVFDRWGELVFEDRGFQPNDPTHGWDGQLKSTKVNPGVFVYWAEVEFIDGEVLIFKGDVTVVR